MVSKVYIAISKVRLCIETVLAGGSSGVLILAYFLTCSNEGDIFKIIAYYETMVCVLAMVIAEWILFVISLLLLGIEKIFFNTDSMKKMMQ